MEIRRYDDGDEEFDRVFENSLNGIDPTTLTEEEIAIQEKWIADNWKDLNQEEA